MFHFLSRNMVHRENNKFTQTRVLGRVTRNYNERFDSMDSVPRNATRTVNVTFNSCIVLREARH